MLIAVSMLLASLCAMLPPLATCAPRSGARAGADEAVGELATRLRNPALSPEDRAAIEERLLALGENGARALQHNLEDRARRIEERVKRAEKGYSTRLERAAKKLLDSRLDRAATAEVEQLRKQVNALRADDGLTKDRIHAEGDPARERLAQILQVEPAAVMGHDRELAAIQQSQILDLEMLVQIFGQWQRCNAALPESKRSKSLADPAQRGVDLAEMEHWVCILTTPMADADRAVLDQNRVLGAQLTDPEEAAGVLDLNRLRLLLGLRALALDVKLCAASRDHSNDMRALGFFDHTSPVDGKKTPWDRAARFGTGAAAENIAGGQDTGAGANLGWWYSPGHHKNMLGNFGRIGLGRGGQLWTQMFG